LQISTYGHGYQGVDDLLNVLRREAIQNGFAQQRNMGGKWVAWTAFVSRCETPLSIVALLLYGILLDGW
jgi:hypothetical protein